MMLTRVIPATALAAVLAMPAIAAPTGAFIVQLGRDTTSAESYTREGNRLVVDQVGRAPRVLRRHFEYEFAPDGGIRHMTVVVRIPQAPVGTPAVQNIEATMAHDSLSVIIRRDTTVQTSRLAAPAGTAVVALSSPWVIYEALTMRLARSKGDSIRVPLLLLGGANVDAMVARRLGRDSMTIENPEGLYHLHVDKDGRILHIVPIKGTAQFTVGRVASLDLDATVAAFSAREKSAGAMGALSTRDTVNATAGGAALWIDYGRPSKRGRAIYGGVVPFGEVWRTGANAATQFRTDKALDFGGSALPAGTYTLWTIPGADGWKLVINGEAGQWGTDHHADKDLLTLPMTVSKLPQEVERFTISVAAAANGGTLNLDWDTTRASIAFTVKP
jgi:hypothetical protein